MTQKIYHTLVGQFASLPFRKIIWIVPVAFTFHEREEWNIMPWWLDHFSNATVISDLALRTWLVFITLIGFLWTGIACLLPTVRATGLMVFPFFVMIPFSNSLQHVYWQFTFEGYAPAFLSCAILNIPSVLLVSWHAGRNRLVNPIFLGTLFVLAILYLLGTILESQKEPAFFHEILTFSAWLADHLFGVT